MFSWMSVKKFGTNIKSSNNLNVSYDTNNDDYYTSSKETPICKQALNR